METHRTGRLVLLKIEERQAQMRPGWYAHSSSVGVRTGPYGSKSEARESMRLAPDARAVQRAERGTDYPYPFDLLVWLEEAK